MKKKAISAILAVFPTIGEYETFLSLDSGRRITDSLLVFATQMGIISESKEVLFHQFIDQHNKPSVRLEPPEKITMETLLNNKDDFLQTGLSGRGLVARINSLLEKYHIELPKISNTMLTRIKKEPADTFHKQNVLRSLAFWLGFERDELNKSWNYVTLKKICHKINRPISTKEGVRIGFSLVSRGDIIEHDIITWLKRELKQYIKENIEVVPYGQWGVVRAYDITTLYVDFPKEEEISDLSCYRQSMRNAISLAHQLAIRWALSSFASQKRFLVIGIAAGSLTTLDNYIQPLLNAVLPENSVIRVSDFARQCILINDIRATLNAKPIEVKQFNGEHLNVWWIEGLWSFTHWSFVPSLLNDEAIVNPNLLYQMLNTDYFSPSKGQSSDMKNAITALLQFPQNCILGIEIAKTLCYRNKLWEALDVLRIVLSVNALNFHARSLRMVIYRMLGTTSVSYSVAKMQFNRAEKEAYFVLSTDNVADEDFFDEYAVLKLAHAIKILTLLRQQKSRTTDSVEGFNRTDVFKLLNEAEHYFEIGNSISPSGTRSIYLSVCVRMLKYILSVDEEIFTNPEKSIAIPVSVARKPALDLVYVMGWANEEVPIEDQLERIDTALLSVFKGHDNAIALDAYRPTIYFCFAVALWDIYPERSVKTGRNTIRMLKRAIEFARQCRKENLYIYSYIRLHGEMLHPDTFIKRIEESISKIEIQIAYMEKPNLTKSREEVELERYLLFTHHID